MATIRSLVLLLFVLEVGHPQRVFLPPPIRHRVLLFDPLRKRHLLLAHRLVPQVVHPRQQREGALIVVEIQSEEQLVGFVGLGGLGSPHHWHLQLEEAVPQPTALQLQVHHLDLSLPPLLLFLPLLIAPGGGGAEHGDGVAGEAGGALHGSEVGLVGLGGEAEEAVEEAGVFLDADGEFGDADGFLGGGRRLHGCYYTPHDSFVTHPHQTNPTSPPNGANQMIEGYAARWVNVLLKGQITMEPDAPEAEQSPPPAEAKIYYPVFTTEGMPSIIAKKVAGLVEELNSDVVNIQSLKAFLGEGIPDEAALIRQYTWKLILGYLPPERAKWDDTIAKQQHTYRGLVHMFLPPEKFPEHPIPLKKNHPRFQQLEEDYLLWEQIEKDTSRTHAQFSFFATECPPIMVPYFTSARKEKFKLIYGDNDKAYKSFLADQQQQRKTYRYDQMSRILYVYSKLNPRIQYVQGMNQILAPIFYLVNITRSTKQIDESACFFMFNNAICDLIELHIKDLDKSHSGIYGKLNEVNQMLMVIEPEIWERMELLKIDPFFYCFRWVTLLYAQDFQLFDTIRLWQSIFAAKHKLQFINYVAIAIIKQCEAVIMEQQFTTVLEHLQDLRTNVAVHTVIGMAAEYQKVFEDVDYQEEGARMKKEIEKKRKKKEKQRLKEEERAEKEQKKQEKRERERLEREERQREEEESKKEEEGGSSTGESGEGDMADKLKRRTSGWLKKMGNAVNKFWN